MSYLRRHVDRRARCAVRLDGRQLVFSYQEQGRIMNRIVNLDFDAVAARVDVDGQGVRWCVVNSGRAVLIREDTGEQVTIAPDGIGAGWAHVRALDKGCEVYLMQDGGVNVYHETGWFKRRYEMAFASEGIHHIEPDGTPVSEDATRYPSPAERALLLQVMDLGPTDPGMMRLDNHDGAILAQFANAPGLGFLRDGTLSTLEPAPLDTQQSSYFGISESGEVWFAVSGFDTLEPWEYRLEPKAKPLPAPTVPTTPQEPPPPTIPPKAEPTVPTPPSTPTPPPAPPQVPTYTKQEVQELVNRASSRLPYLLKRLNGPSEMRRAVARELEAQP
jgi:hypothetical protein